jgi:CRISPR type III-A-associated protein Csm2
MEYVKNSFQSSWITNKIEKETVVWAKNFGSFLAIYGGNYKENKQGQVRNETSKEKELSTTQLRKFFGQLKRLQAEVQVDGNYQKHEVKMLMLAPQLAYAVGRNKKKLGRNIIDTTKIGHFHDEITSMLNSVSEDKHFNNFVNIIEAVVAYHKFEGGE